MAEKEEQLAIDIIAKLNNLEKQMAKASGITARAYREMSLGSKKATKQMEDDAVRSSSRINQAMATISSKVGGYSKAFGAGLIGGITAGGVAGISAAVKGAAASFAELGREAKTAGINVEDFQRWRYVADQNKIGIDALIDGFKELNLRADEYIQTGKGSSAEAFQRLGMSPDEVKERIKDPSAFMLELIDRTRRLKDTAAGIRIFDELLGGSGGEQFVRLIEQGRQGITDTLNEANKMGVVFDENFIKRADEIDKAFQRISVTVGTALKGAIVDAATALSNFISQFNEMEDKNLSGINSELAMLATRKTQLQAQAGSTEDSILGLVGRDAATELVYVNEQMAKLNSGLERRAKIKITPTNDAPVAPYVPPSTKKVGKSSGDREREKAARETERERKAVEALIAELEFEASLVGKSALEKEKLTAVRQAGASATDVEKQKIEGLVESIYRQNEAFDAAQQRLADINDAAREATGTLISGLLDGKSGAESLADALAGVADRLLNDVLDSIFKINQAGGGGIFGSLLGGLFGSGGGGFGANFFPSAPSLGAGIGMYARGTDFAPGGAAIVGEQGPELLKLPRGAQVTPNHQLAQAVNGGGGQSSTQQNVQVAVAVSVDKNGNLQAYVQDVAQSVAVRTTRQGIKVFSEGQGFSNATARALQSANKRGMLR